MSEEQVFGVIGIASVYRDDGTAFSEEALRALAEKDDRFEYEEETGKLLFTTTWGEACLRGLPMEMDLTNPTNHDIIISNSRPTPGRRR